MLAHQRRKRQEVCNKVGETPQYLGPPTTYTSNHTTHLHEGGLNGQNNGQRGRQGGAYSDQNTHGRDEGRGGPPSGFAPPQQLHGGQIGGGQADGYFQSEPQGAGGRLQPGDNNIHIAGPVPAPVFCDARPNYLSPTTFDPSPLQQVPSYAQASSPSYPTDLYGPPREVRSAGHAPPSNAFAAPHTIDVVQSTPRGVPLGGAVQSPARGSISQAPQQAGPSGQLQGPLYGRRAQTTDLNGREAAAAQRQSEYQREIEAQMLEVRARKQQERDRIKREDDDLERRVQEDRVRLANKERQEREKEVKDREDKEAAQFAKRRGGNHKPTAPDSNDHKNELQRQIEEKRKRKEEEEETKRRADEQYDRKYGGSGAAPSPTIPSGPQAQPRQGNDGSRASVSVAGGQSQMLAGSNAAGLGGGGFTMAGGQGGNPNVGVPLPSHDFMGNQNWSSQPYQASSVQQPSYSLPLASPAVPQDTQMSKMKDEIFSMLVDQHRMQQQQPNPYQMQFPPQASASPALYLGSPSYAPHSPAYGGGGGYNALSAAYQPNNHLYGSGPYGAMGGGQMMPDFGRQAPPGGAYAPPPLHSPDMYGGMGRYPQHVQQHAQGTQDVLRRFLEEDRSEAVHLSAAPPLPPVTQDDISMELPTEQVRLVGRRRGN